MEWMTRKLSLSKRRKDRLLPWHIENGGKLLEGFIALFNGKYDISYRVFSVEELTKALNLDCTGRCPFSRRITADVTGHYLFGTFQQRPILVKKFWVSDWEREGWDSYVVNDIVVSLLMNRHKNVLKVLGCCLDLAVPAIIYEPGINYRLLSDVLSSRQERNSQNDRKLLSWSSRLKIATNVANTLVFLHSEFCTPVIHRNLTTRNIVIDQHGVAKLVDFSLCIALPSGESQVIDNVIGTTGYLEPIYSQTGIITEKTDVYMFGMILLQLLTGLRNLYHSGEPIVYVGSHSDKDELSRILDPTMLGKGGEIEQEHQLLAFSELGLRCTRGEGAEKPEMIDVAKELVKIQRSVHPS